ncbi:ribonuclease E inhibitor RraB [Rhizobium sp. ZK1]|uniref:ribonuclease E inhibitor RraB n=1 Tax=Rhizobium sp. ZK1 TaxID=3389872 RepID=UPI0039F67C75
MLAHVLRTASSQSLRAQNDVVESVVFSQLQAPNDIDKQTELLDVSAAKLGGEYDGWETTVHRGK